MAAVPLLFLTQGEASTHIPPTQKGTPEGGLRTEPTPTPAGPSLYLRLLPAPQASSWYFQPDKKQVSDTKMVQTGTLKSSKRHEVKSVNIFPGPMPWRVWSLHCSVSRSKAAPGRSACSERPTLLGESISVSSLQRGDSFYFILSLSQMDYRSSTEQRKST